MKIDSLFRLIKALDKGQLRYCRQALAMAQGDMTESRLVVFDQLYSMTEYDADALKNQKLLESEAGPAGTRTARERSQQIKSQLQLPAAHP